MYIFVKTIGANKFKYGVRYNQQKSSLQASQINNSGDLSGIGWVGFGWFEWIFSTTRIKEHAWIVQREQMHPHKFQHPIHL